VRLCVGLFVHGHACAFAVPLPVQSSVFFFFFLLTRAGRLLADVFAVNPSLDSSLKKNTAFIKRLRTAVTAASLSTFLQEIRTLSLHKYLSEIVAACYEGLCRVKSPQDFDAATEIVSALHQRFGPDEFTGHLGWLLGKGLATPDRSYLKTLPPEGREREEKDRITRQRALLRIATELWLVQALRTLDDVIKSDEATKSALSSSSSSSSSSKPADGSKSKVVPLLALKGGSSEPFPIEVLKDLLGHDREHANLALLVLYVKTYSWDLLGVRPAADGRRAADSEGAAAKPDDATEGIPPANGDVTTGSSSDTPLAPDDFHARFKAILQRYFDDVAAHIVRDQKSIQSQARRNAEAYVKSGEVFEDRQANYEKQVKAQDMLVSQAQVLADVLGSDMPDVKALDDGMVSAAGGIGLVRTGEYLRARGEGAGIWEDEEQRRFYENLVDLKGKVPAILLEDVKKKKTDDDQVGKRVDTEAATEGGSGGGAAAAATIPEAPPAAGESATEEQQSTVIANKSIGAQVDALLARLPDITAKDAVDQAAIDFGFLNSKASRNRLIKALCDVPKGRTDLLAPWARLIATLGRYMADIPKAMVEHLDSEFRSLQRRKDKDFLGQVRLGNVRYLAELTKFGIVPEHVVFHCLKVSLDDFSRINIEIMCHLLENCGRYLFRSAETAPRMASFLETLQRKKTVSHIGQQERMLIENAVYFVDPPQTPAIQQKERTPMDMFVRKLIYTDLTKRNHIKVLKQIRRLHWEEPEVVELLLNVFSKPADVKYANIHVLAILLGALYPYHPDFVVRVVDRVVESILYGFEQNDFRFYQKRIAEVRYLAELYNYHTLEHPVIFDVLYRIVMFGYGAGYPVPGRVNQFDFPNEFFRIRLVTTILDTCGTYFQRGAAGKKLDAFLAFFQYYIFTKDPLPMDVEFLVQDMYTLVRPNWKLAADLDEAVKALQLASGADRTGAAAATATAVDEDPADDANSDVSSRDGIDDDMDRDVEDDDGDGEDDGGDDDLGGDEDGALDFNDADARDSAGEEFGYEDLDDEAGGMARRVEIDPEEAAEFDREFAKMMNESLETRKSDRKPIFDLALPVKSKNRVGMEESEGVVGGTMAFSLLTKKGNRQHVSLGWGGRASRACESSGVFQVCGVAS
jgi:regulator of nonsense transcripts 2